MNSEIEAAARIRVALDLIEQAQRSLGMACSELSRVCGSDDHWKLVGDGYDAVHNLWRRVNEKTAARKYRMDSDWERELSR